MFSFSINRKLFTHFLLLPLLFIFLTTSISAQVAGQVPLNPQNIPQFVDPLPHFAGLRVNAKAGGNLTVKMVAHKQIAVSTGTKLALGTVGPLNPLLGLANVWAYQISKDAGVTFTNPLWPAYTIEAERDPAGTKALNVTYVNELTAPTGGAARYSDVGLVVDQTLHWADPFIDGMLMTPYTNEVPTTVHLHGGEVQSNSDGNPDSWFTPGNAKTGTAFNSSPYIYPNTQEAATLWFHDHTLGVTRLNVYAGLAGFYLLRGGAVEDALHLPGWSGDDLVQEATGFAAGAYLPELEVVIQDRMFDTNGGLYFPNLPTNPLVHPTWTPEFVGDVITVNGKTWPYLSVAPRKYRFRLLNGSNARFYNLSFPKGGPTITQIGTDGGFLDAPVPLLNGPLLLAPGERADVIIDFTAFSPKKMKKILSFILGNDARTPFPGGAVVKGNTTGRIMEFVVSGTMVSSTLPAVGVDKSLIPAALKTNVKLTNFAVPNTPLVSVVKTRQLTLNEVMGAGGPLEVLVNNTKWAAAISENPMEGSAEIWQIINLTADAHPIHLHLVQFQLMSRQPFNVAGYDAAYNALFAGGVFNGGFGPPLLYSLDQRLTGELIPTIGGNPNVKPFLLGAALAANPNEQGWKDTYIMYPGEVTTVIARWSPTDIAVGSEANNQFAFDPKTAPGYVWHCHIIDHEDNEMMRPYKVEINPALAKRSVLAANSDPTSFELSQNYPNPFNPNTVINFSVPEENTLVSLKIYNSLGEEVGTLINQVVPSGNHQVNFNASSLSSGVYFYTLNAGKFVESKKMILMK